MVTGRVVDEYFPDSLVSVIYQFVTLVSFIKHGFSPA